MFDRKTDALIARNRQLIAEARRVRLTGQELRSRLIARNWNPPMQRSQRLVTVDQLQKLIDAARTGHTN
jgi:hypothetical protein